MFAKIARVATAALAIALIGVSAAHAANGTSSMTQKQEPPGSVGHLLPY